MTTTKKDITIIHYAWKLLIDKLLFFFFLSFLLNTAFGFLSFDHFIAVSGKNDKNRIYTKLFCFQTHLAIQEIRSNTKLRFKLLAQGKHPGNNFLM